MEGWKNGTGMCRGTVNGFISEGRKTGDGKAEAVLCVTAGPDNLLSLVFPEWRHSGGAVVAVITLPSCVAQLESEIGSTSLRHCHRDRFLSVTDSCGRVYSSGNGLHLISARDERWSDRKRLMC